MNHTERIIHVSRQVRGLTREHARQAVELYLESVANELAHSELVKLPSVGRLHIVIRKNGGRILADINAKHPRMREPGQHVQGCPRLSDDLKAQCRRNRATVKMWRTNIIAVNLMNTENLAAVWIIPRSVWRLKSEPEVTLSIFAVGAVDS